MDIPNFDDLLQQIKTKLWLAGIDFEQPYIYKRFYISFTILFIVATQEILYFMLYASFDNFLKITQVLPCTCTCITTFVKIVTLLIKKKEVNHLTNNLQELYKNNLKEEYKINIMRIDIIFSRHLMKAMTVFNVILICVYNSSSLFTMLFAYVRKQEVIFDLPFPVAMPVEVDWWLPWLVEYLLSITAGFFCVLLFTAFDSAYFFLSTNLFINFSVLGESIRKIKGTRCRETLIVMIKRHQHIIRLSEVLEEIFNIPNFFNVMFGSLQICFLGFTISMGSWAQIPQSAFLLSAILIQLLTMSYFGEKLMNESRRVGEAAFQSNWYNMDETSKKMIHFIVLRSQTPQRLTAYKFFKISYNSFAGIISKSWSYFSILRTVYKPTKNYA